MKKTQNVRSSAIKPFTAKPFVAVLVLSASTAFAASSSATTAAPSTPPLAQAAPRTSQPAPTVPSQTNPGQAGQGKAVCGPDPMKTPGQTGRNADSANSAAPTGTPAPLKNGARSAPGQTDPAALNCLPPRPPRGGQDQMQPGGMPQGQQTPGGPAGRNGAGPDGQGQTDAARLQNDLTRLNALLAQTTDAKARSYLADARTLLQSGDPRKIRAAHGLIRAAEALSGAKK